MQYIHVKNLEKYNPGYSDRTLIWCKIYFTMLNSNYEFSLIDDIDKWRLIALIMLELQMKKPIPYDENWLQNKISNHKRSISQSIKMLHNFIELVTDSPTRTYRRVEKSRVEKNVYNEQFEEFYLKYPKRVGKKDAVRHFNASVKNETDWGNIQQALNNYLKSERVKKGFIQNASTWFNNWQDWIDYKETKEEVIYG